MFRLADSLIRAATEAARTMEGDEARFARGRLWYAIRRTGKPEGGSPYFWVDVDGERFYLFMLPAPKDD